VVVIAVPVLYVPVVQREHTETPVFELYVPAAHFVQNETPEADV